VVMSKRELIPVGAPTKSSSAQAQSGKGINQQGGFQSKITRGPQQSLARPTSHVAAAPTASRPQPAPRVLQKKKMAVEKQPQANRLSRQPNAPPVYRPQLNILQRKAALTRQPPIGPKNRVPVPPPVYRPQPAPKVLQTRGANNQPGALSGINSRAVTSPVRPVGQQASIQPSMPKVVQAIKFYPNLHPGAAVPVDRNNVYRLNSFADQYRLHRLNSHGAYIPNLKYNFVRTREGEILMHNRYRHPSLAEGQQVLYAGEIYFDNGKLEWWSNASGHYQPDEEDARQANLPMDRFFTYQQIIKGDHPQKRDSSG